jgi:hypothetical protein
MKTSSAFWPQHLKAFSASGLSQAEYCRREGLKAHQLAYQLKQSSKATGGLRVAPAGFARVLPAPVPDSEPATCRPCGGAVALFFGTSADPAWAAKLLASIAREIK